MDVLNIFSDDNTIKKIQSKLPYLFQLAEVDNSRDGKLGMEIGSTRERIIIALLIHKFGEENVKTDNAITQTEVDVIAFDNAISIKTITGKRINGIKLIWTVDSIKAKLFTTEYYPGCDMILVHINWGGIGYFYYIPQIVQIETLTSLGRDRYFNLPKQGTNPRGVEMSRAAIDEIVTNSGISKIEIDWIRKDIKYNPYERWVDHWEGD